MFESNWEYVTTMILQWQEENCATNFHTKHIGINDWIYTNLKHIRYNMWDDNKTLGMSKRWHTITPPPIVAGNYNMGNRMEKKNWQNIWMGGLMMGECEDRQRKSCIIETNYKHSKGGYGRLPLGDVYTCHGFFQKTRKFEKTDFITFFTSLFSDLLIEYLVTLETCYQLNS